MRSSYRLWRRYTRPFSRLLCILLLLFVIGLFWSIWTVLSIDENDEQDEKPPLIFCFVLSQNDRHLTSSQAIIYTWGKRCDRFYFVTRLQNTSVELMTLEKFENITDITSTTINQFTRDVLLHLRRGKLGFSYDWFLRGSDESYVIVPNLRRLINQIHHQTKHRPFAYVGDVEQMYGKYQIPSTGSVMLFNQEAVRRFSRVDLEETNESELYNSQCLAKMIYDHEFVACMKEIGIDTNPVNENLILSQNLSTYKMDKRLKDLCCNPNTVAFRSSNETDMYKFDFFYHRLDAISQINLY